MNLWLFNFRTILEYLSGSVQICTDSQGVLNMGSLNWNASTDLKTSSRNIVKKDPKRPVENLSFAWLSSRYVSKFRNKFYQEAVWKQTKVWERINSKNNCSWQNKMKSKSFKTLHRNKSVIETNITRSRNKKNRSSTKIYCEKQIFKKSLKKSSLVLDELFAVILSTSCSSLSCVTSKKFLTSFSKFEDCHLGIVVVEKRFFVPVVKFLFDKKVETKTMIPCFQERGTFRWEKLHEIKTLLVKKRSWKKLTLWEQQKIKTLKIWFQSFFSPIAPTNQTPKTTLTFTDECCHKIMFKMLAESRDRRNVKEFLKISAFKSCGFQIVRKVHLPIRQWRFTITFCFR